MKNNFILAAGLSFLMLSCGSAGTPVTAASTTNNSSSTNTGGSTTTNNAWSNFNYTATVSGGESSGYQAVSINPTNKTITVSIPLMFDSTLTGILVNEPLPSIPGATLAFSQLTDGTPVLTVTLPLSTIVKPITGLPTSTLPNGKALPGMPSGSEPSEQIQIGTGKIPVYVYVGEMSVGLFVNTPFNPTLTIDYNIVDSSRNAIGAIYSIPYTSSTQKDGGFFLSVNIPSTYTNLILANIN